jgi:tetratricopeptide (TPR) repeat protein
MFARDADSPAVRRAITFLASGDYERAAAALDAGHNAAPAETAALRTIIAISRNRIPEAQHWSEAALQTDPQSASAQVAASYVRQAVGDLDGALKLARSAAEVAPNDPYAMARLAEMQMVVGDRRAALATANRALAIERIPLALFVAGLAELAASHYEKAEALFNEAINIDSEAPLPRLGLGLTYTRRGRTAAGTWEIERAVILDPRRGSLRTWLARGYFDEELTSKAAEELRLAKIEDPDDPTPYLFSALQLYSQNRPIPALRELQEAEKRGSARRTLRSIRGLGEDTATRGAALGRIYDVLSFDQLAIVEGTKAAETDPSNPGAHRFLADAYRERPGYEIAQTSELLRSQLLSPPSKTPVQPELAENDLALLDTTGPSRVTFAEFSPLFDADGFRFDASGLAGTDTFPAVGRHRALPQRFDQSRPIPLRDGWLSR